MNEELAERMKYHIERLVKVMEALNKRMEKNEKKPQAKKKVKKDEQ